MTRRPDTESHDLALTWCDYRGKESLRVSGWTGDELGVLEGVDAGELNRRLALLTAEALESGVQSGVQSGAEPGAVPAVAGQFEVSRESVYFVPRFPFVAGMRYSLLVRHSLAGRTSDSPPVWNIVGNIQRPARQYLDSPPAANVVAIYPDVKQVPVNLLKFYVQFSEAMSEGKAQQAIRVCRDDTQEPLDGVFVPMDPELWDRSRQRLTLLLDPARIKHGLVPNLEVGYPLIEGVPFRLFIDPDFRDARGRPLKAGAERRYEVGSEVRLRIDPQLWKLSVPAAGSLDPLAVEFERPLDYALLQRCLWVSGPRGTSLSPHRTLVAGSGETGQGEGSWLFTPESPWVEGRHQLIVERQLEDLAGNSPVRVFDRDMTEPDDGPPLTDWLAVDFTCAAG